MLKRPWHLLAAVLAVVTFGCVSSGEPALLPAAAAGAPPSVSRAVPGDLKSRLDAVLRSKVKESRVAARLGTFSLEDYDIQDPGTFWGHRALASAGLSLSEYYFTYRSNYVILLLKDQDELHHTCIDARLFPRTSPDYELTTGRVQVNGGAVDEEVIVLVNKRWKGASTTDITAAFKANVERGTIEKIAYDSIVIYREE